jgi:cytochrome c-type biogenesis protein CcmH
MGRFLLFFLLLQFLFVGAAYAADNDFDYKSEAFKEVASQFYCNCGCGQDHFECDPNTCSNTKSFKKELADRMKLGWTKDQIRDYYVKTYGEEILMAPQKKGFDMTAWATPFAALGVGGGGLFFAMRRWVGRNKKEIEEQTPEESDENKAENEIMKSMIDEERKKFF